MSTTSTKPQIFINHVDLTILEEIISKACEEICSNKPTSITLRPSHDKKNNLCVITLSNETEAETLLKAGSITVNNIALKIEEYQAQFPNLFLKNTNNLISEQELQEGLKDLIKGNFHVYYGSGYVSFFIQDQEELAKLVNQTVNIKGKPCTFEKYVVSSAKKEKTHLFLRFSDAHKEEIPKKLLESLTKQSIPLVSFSSRETKNNYFTISIIFEQQSDAEKLFKDIEDEKHILFGQTVSVSWKKSEDVEQEDKFIIVKWLNLDVTEETLKTAFSIYGEIQSIEIQTVVAGELMRKLATLQMSSSDSCIQAMSKACANLNIQKLFFKQRVQVSPYFSKSEQEKLKKATQSQAYTPQDIVQTQLAQQSQVPQYAQQFQMMQGHQFDQNQYQQQFIQMQQQMYFNMNNQRKQYYNNNYQNNNSNYRQQDRNANNQTQKGEENKNQYETGNQYYGNNQPNNQRKNKNYNHNRPQQQQQYQQYRPQQGGQGVNPKPQSQGQNQQVVYQKQSQQGHQQMTLQQMQEQAKNPEKFKEIVLPRLNNLIHQELKDRYPEQMSQQTQIFEMLTDSEVLTNEEIVNFLYQSKELKERIDEAIALILS